MMKSLVALLLIASAAWGAYSPNTIITDAVNTGYQATVLPGASAATSAAEPLVVTLHPSTASAPVTGTFWQSTQPVSSTQLPASLDGSGYLKTHEQGTATITGSVNQGSSTALSGAWPIKVTDGTNTMPTMDSAARAGFHEITDGTNVASVKAASTAAVASDKALVVAVSPNNSVQLGASTATIGALSANQSVNMTQWNGNTVAASTPIPVGFSTSQVAPKTYPNATASFVINTGQTTVATTESAPANAVGFILEASSANGFNFRWAIGATATTSSGMRLEPGRDSGFVPSSANISIISESGTNEYQLTWVRQ